MKNYKCGSRKRRNVIIEPFDNANADVLNDVVPEFRDVVKRTADDKFISLKDLSHIVFWPSKAKEEDAEERQKREAEEEEEKKDSEEDKEEEVSVQKRDAKKEGRFFFSGVTVMQTSTTTTTSTLTSTIGTVGITGTASACAGTSISEYFSKCG